MNPKLQKAIINLIFYYPFFSVINGKMKYIENDKKPTMCTNGKYIEYNNSFIEKLNINEITSIIIHELLHVIFGHVGNRFKKENPKKWNIATDYSINGYLKEIAGITLPKDLLYDKKYENLSAEEIFNLIPDEDNYTPYGEIIHDSNILQEEIDEIIRESIMISEMYNKDISEKLKIKLKNQIESKIDWREYICSFVTEKIKNDYSFNHCNKRYINNGFFIPSLYNEKLGQFLIGIDTSGSINIKDLEEFSGHLNSLQRIYNIDFKVLYIDTKISGEEFFDSQEDIELKPFGGGGTNFKPLFNYYEESDEIYSGIIYFTDLYGEFPENKPDINVLWVTRNIKTEVPFGTKVVYED